MTGWTSGRQSERLVVVEGGGGRKGRVERQLYLPLTLYSSCWSSL